MNVSLRCLVLALCLAPLPSAFADCPEHQNITVQLACSVDLMGLSQAQPTLTNESAKKALTLSDVGGEEASIRFGDHQVSSRLACSGADSSSMDWQLEVRLTQDGRPYADPIDWTMVRNLELGARSTPLEIASVYFFPKPLVLETQPDGEEVEMTRLDYMCEIRVIE